MIKQFIAGLIAVLFGLNSLFLPAYAAQPTVLDLPQPGAMVGVSPAFDSLSVKGVRVHPDNPLLFDFVIDPGDTNLKADDPKTRQASERLIKYFLACLTIPENDLWVNLSPYEKDQIVPTSLGQTELGRDMLAQDYILKQLTSSLIYPEKQLGREFWNKVYTKAQQTYGTTQIPVNTFNKVWVLADTAKIYEHKDTAYLVSSHLKVMLDEDYLAAQKGTLAQSTGTNSLGNQVIREIILPEIEKEVNQGKNFAPLRQIYSSFILAAWYKKNLKTALLNQVYANKNKVAGVEAVDQSVKDKIYQQYIEAYKKGVFNYIKDPDPTNVGSGATSLPRKYFSGGELLKVNRLDIVTSEAMLSESEAQAIKQAKERAFLAATVMNSSNAQTPAMTVVKPKVLLVDTKAALADMTKRLFEKQGYELQIVGSNEEALKEMASHLGGYYQAAIVAKNRVRNDSMGLKLIEQLNEAYPNLPVILTSGDFARLDILTQPATDLPPNIKVVMPGFSHPDLVKQVMGAILKSDPTSEAMTTEIKTLDNARLLMPTIDFKPGAPLNVDLIRPLIKRSSDQVRALLLDAKKNSVVLRIIGYLRGLDGPGSSLDLPEFQKSLVKILNKILKRLGIRGFNELPSTVTIASDKKAEVVFEASDDPEAIEYIAPDYGINEDAPYKVVGEVKLTEEGRLPDKQKQAVAYIFRNIFGLKGVKITMKGISPIALAGGMESSNTFNVSLITAASVLSGANLSYADIVALAVKLENDEIGGLTGGQGHWSTILGRAQQLFWLSGVEGNKYGVAAKEILNDKQIENIEEHVALVQAGKEYVNGKAVTNRTAALTNWMWTDLLRFDPIGQGLHAKKVELASRYAQALAEGDFETAARICDQYVDIRDAITIRWVNLMMDAHEGKDVPAYAKEFERKVFRWSSDEERKDYEVLRNLYEQYQQQGRLAELRTISLYSMDPISTLIKNARKEGIAIFPLGAGGISTNMEAVSPKGQAHLKSFFESQGLYEITDEIAGRIVKGTGTLKGFMPFKVGRDPIRVEGFDVLQDDQGRLENPYLPFLGKVEGKEVHIDPAMIKSNATTPGGIDLKAADLKIEVDQRTGAVHMQLDPALLARFSSGDFSGVTPRILSIVPAAGQLNLLDI